MLFFFSYSLNEQKFSKTNDVKFKKNLNPYHIFFEFHLGGLLLTTHIYLIYLSYIHIYPQFDISLLHKGGKCRNCYTFTGVS